MLVGAGREGRRSRSEWRVREGRGHHGKDVEMGEDEGGQRALVRKGVESTCSPRGLCLNFGSVVSLFIKQRQQHLTSGVSCRGEHGRGHIVYTQETFVIIIFWLIVCHLVGWVTLLPAWAKSGYRVGKNNDGL